MSLFSRITTRGSVAPEIDGLRCFAILGVILFHLVWMVGGHRAVPESDPFMRLAWSGRFGVEVFFGLSGYLLSWSWARHYISGEPRPSLSQYALRRVTRIEPPYFLALLVCWALQAGWGQRWLSGHLAAGLVYGHGLIYGTLNPVSPITWSLEVEIQWYIAAPCVCWLFSRRALVRRPVFAALAVGATLLAPSHGLSLAGNLQHFLVGVLLADIQASGAPSHRTAWDGFGLAGFALMLPCALLAPAAFPLCAFLAIGGTLRGDRLRRAFSNALAAGIGCQCYSIYLYHLVVLGALSFMVAWLPEAWPLAAAAGVLVFTPLTLAACAVPFLAIERPFMQREWPERLRAWFRERVGRVAKGTGAAA